MSARTNIPAHVVQDPRFEPFRLDDFDAGQFTSRALSDALSSAQTTGQQLREDIKGLEGGIRREVVEKQSALKEVVSEIAETEASVAVIDRTVQRLGTSVGELQSSLDGPCQRLRQRTAQLRNLRATIETLRNVGRRLKLLKKLKLRIGEANAELDGVDLPEVARLLHELHANDGEVNVQDIEVLKPDVDYLERTTQRVRSAAEQTLMKGQEAHNQADIGNALHVYFNLNELPSAVEMVLSKKATKLSHKGRSAFDFHRLAAASRATGQSSLQETLWTSLVALISDMEEDTMDVCRLQQVLSKKHDPLTHVSFLSVISDGHALTDRFWTQAVGVFERSVLHVVQPGKSTPVREVLVHGFAKLCSLAEAAVARLSERSAEKSKASLLGERHLEELLNSFASVQSVYAARSLTHMLETVQSVFSAGSRSVPPPTEIQKIVGVFHEEMKQAEGSIRACQIVASNVASAALAIAERVRMLGASGPELRAVGGSCNGAQLRNMSLCSSLQDIHKSLVALVSKLNQKGAEFLVPACETLRAAGLECINPIFKAVVDALEQQLMTMHGLEIWRSDVTAAAPSPHVQALWNQLRSFSVEYLTRFTPPFSPGTPSFVRSLVKKMANRVVVFFVRHAALIRPLSAIGRRQLALDATEIENLLTQTLLPVSGLRSHSGTLHAFRELLQIEPSQIRDRPNVLHLPRSVVLHHLFTYAPASMKLPHERIGLTPSQFSFWLDSRTGEEAVLGVRSALDAAAVEDGEDEIRAVILDLCKGQTA